jgi:hypothetical protein
MDPLSQLTYETFRDRVGESFRDAEADVTFDLLEVEDLTPIARNVSPDARTPFSLLFRGPAEPALPQGIRALEHHELGALPIFLVPIAMEQDGLRYQAIFS